MVDGHHSGEYPMMSHRIYFANNRKKQGGWVEGSSGQACWPGEVFSAVVRFDSDFNGNRVFPETASAQGRLRY
jgi:hypothetical protein